MALPIEIVGKANDWSDWLAVAAALLQAVLSGAAIVAAGLITNHDRRETIRTQRQQRSDALAAVLFDANVAISQPYRHSIGYPFLKYPDVFRGPAWATNERRRHRCLRILRQVPIHELESNIANAVLLMEEALVEAEPIFEAINKGYPEAVLYPDQAQVDLSVLKSPVNLAARAWALVEDETVRNSFASRDSKKKRNTPWLV